MCVCVECRLHPSELPDTFYACSSSYTKRYLEVYLYLYIAMYMDGYVPIYIYICACVCTYMKEPSRYPGVEYHFHPVQRHSFSSVSLETEAGEQKHSETG